MSETLSGAYPHIRIRLKDGSEFDIPVDTGETMRFACEVEVVGIFYKPHRENLLLLDPSVAVVVEKTGQEGG